MVKGKIKVTLSSSVVNRSVKLQTNFDFDSLIDRHRVELGSLVRLGKWKFKIFVIVCTNASTCNYIVTINVPVDKIRRVFGDN